MSRLIFEKNDVRVEKESFPATRSSFAREELFVCYDGHDLGQFPVQKLTAAIDWAILVASKPAEERKYWKA